MHVLQVWLFSVLDHPCNENYGRIPVLLKSKVNTRGEANTDYFDKIGFFCQLEMSRSE